VLEKAKSDKGWKELIPAEFSPQSRPKSENVI